MKFTVQRSTWYRGRGALDSRLLRADGQKCCLGFFGLACGISELALLDKPSPRSVKGKPPKDFMFLTNGIPDSPLCGEIMRTNDDPMDEKNRESKLINLFKSAGHTVEFVD